MTPPARIAAAIGILDDILGGKPAEQPLVTWARTNRYAGSGDRAAVRDHVFDALRRRRSYAALGGAETGRGLMLGSLRHKGEDPAHIFSGVGYAPAPLTIEEAAHRPGPLSDAEALDIPDWLEPALRDSLRGDFTSVLETLQSRAAVHLRVNVAKTTKDAAMAVLAEEGIETTDVAQVATALRVTAHARRVSASRAYAQGLVDLQDAASQLVVLDLAPLPPKARILDYCAGGGGKALALAALAPDARITAHDGKPERLTDLPKRAQRAGAAVHIAKSAERLAPAAYDLVLCDVPCSGSGSWRRSPGGKWTLTPERLHELEGVQVDILNAASSLVAPKGRLAYVTCSLQIGRAHV